MTESLEGREEEFECIECGGKKNRVQYVLIADGDKGN